MEYFQSLLHAENAVSNFWEFLKSHPAAKVGQKSTVASTTFKTEGNVLLKQNKHNEIIIKEVLIQYSKSVAYAEPKSEELVSGFSNRSIVLRHVKKYDLCLVDIDVAIIKLRH